MSDVPEAQEPEKMPEVQVPAPKKRGRKRKSEMALRQVEEVIDMLPVEETVSRRGRPRKKVNYYELANPDNLDFQVSLEKQITYYNLENFEQNKKRKIEKSDSLNEDADVLPLENTVVQTKVEENVSEQSETSTIANGSLQDVPTEATNLSADANASFDYTTLNSEATTSTPSKDKKYNYTGETVKMMNTLFNLFNTDENPAQDSTTKVNNSETNSSKNGKRAYRKSKKYNTINDEEMDDSSVSTVTCAICNSSMDKSLWTHHKQRYHNNLAWRVGDSPLDLNDQSFVMHTLHMLYKKKKPLYCDKCGKVKKSVVGFLSHRSQCLKSEEQLESVKIACEICGRKMLPVSMSTHMKMLHSEGSEKVKNGSDKSNNDLNKPLASKRSAAKKAMRIIETVTKNDDTEKYFTRNLDLGSQEFARTLMQKELDETKFFECKFSCNCITTNIEDAIKHMEECTEKLSEGFVCKRCLTVSGTLEEIIYHVEFSHEISVEKDDDRDPSFTEKESSKLPSFMRCSVKKLDKVLFPFAFEWTFKFCEENFSDYHLEELGIVKPSWNFLPRDQAIKYLPKLNESCHVARTFVTSFINPLGNKYEFRKYNLFESEVHDNKITLFCGGPISALAWVPTPYLQESENQVLAVSVLNSPDDKFPTSENFHVESAIQFWNFGNLQNKEYSLQEPEMIFCLAHDHGPVWHMEWCPSGCYKGDRMGLLAVTGSDSIVYIYAIPFLQKCQMGLFYKPKPVMKLLLQRNENPRLGGLKYYPTKISWSKAAGHQYLCVGYTNGFVALFNIKSTSFILKFKDSDGVPCVLPSKCFQAHAHAITILALHHLSGGCKWLLTGSFDRRVSVWDLENYSYPICSNKKNIVTDGFWFTNWLCYGIACDEGSTATSYVSAILKQVRDYLSDPNVTMTCSHATISAVSGSDWLNGIVHANSVGEIIAVFPHQLLNFSEHHKTLKSKRMLFGYTCLLEKNKPPKDRLEDDALRKKTLHTLSTKKMSTGSSKLSKIKADVNCDKLFANEPIIYDEAAEKYALLFCDNKMNSYDDFPKSAAKQLTALSKVYGVTAPNRYPLTTVNKIVFNPNRQASLYYATGYQAGFVRISWMEFLKGDHQVK
ncbi:uncharacterized protein LOC135122905 isoform X1 [Zophobas morio]|uniref:uncharacterized protein LOC135122905 isoform X1 n=1 Tax=Zophobas morio TaxID=2755281 RepID=UPI0030832022